MRIYALLFAEYVAVFKRQVAVNADFLLNEFGVGNFLLLFVVDHFVYRYGFVEIVGRRQYFQNVADSEPVSHFYKNVIAVFVFSVT